MERFFETSSSFAGLDERDENDREIKNYHPLHHIYLGRRPRC